MNKQGGGLRFYQDIFGRALTMAPSTGHRPSREEVQRKQVGNEEFGGQKVLSFLPLRKIEKSGRCGRMSGMKLGVV
jgi:hypothetical protein